jgi:hypothetical protein
MNRRQLLIASGVGGVALLGFGPAWCAVRLPKTAMAPWTVDPAPVPDLRLDAMRYAILAPNPHNRQPWLMQLVGADVVDLRCDLSKRLPQTDPFDRQITIGFGTFIELARIAAAERGFAVTVEAFPDGEPSLRLDDRPVARLRFAEDQTIKRDPLFGEILRRRSNKEAYDLSKTPSDALLAKIGAEGEVARSVELLSGGREAILDAIKIETATPRTHKESIDLLRIGDREIDANPDGIALNGPKIKIAKLLGMLDRRKMVDPESSAFKAALDQQLSTSGSVPALFWIKTPGNTRSNQLEAGRRYVRANLQATALGLAMHPLSQSLQEYPEVGDPFRKIHQLLGAVGEERIQMLARVGYGPVINPAPRWPLETHIVT